VNILAVTIGGLGDAVLFSPVIKALRVRYPQAIIRLLVASKLAASAYAGASEIDAIACLDISNRSTARLGMQLCKFCAQSRWLNGSYDLGVYATGLDTKLAKGLKVFAGVRRTVCGPKPPQFPTDLECNVALARRFEPGISTADAFIPITEAAEAEAKRTLQAAGVRTGEPVIAVYASSDLPHRPRWALSNFVEIIRRIKEQNFEGKIVAVGTRAEGREWRDADRERLIDANLTGKLSITGSAAVLRRCSLTIGNDGGLMHVAGAVGSPAVVVMVSGRTLIINKELEESSAFVAAWLPGSEGQGVADVLFGDYDFQGQLSFTWQKKEGENFGL